MNIWGVGRNYIAHAAELNNPIPETPLIFLKSGNCLEVAQTQITLPSWSIDVHHEVELIVKIDAQKKVSHLSVALDLTERHFQALAKQKGLPWTLAKSFKGSTPMASWVEYKSQNLESLELKLWVNDELRQSSSTSQMIFKIPQLINFIDLHFPLAAGDVILTGTPEGVGPLKPGDIVIAEIPGVAKQTWNVAS